MKSNILSLLVFTAIFTYTTTTQAQVGIGTNSPGASAQLEISSSSKGFLPPRVTLTGTADATTIASPATGLMVYNTATAGTSPSNVTPGIYYYDGAKWQRVINQQPDATVEFDKATPTTAGVVFTPNTPASKDYVYVSSVDNSQWTYNGTAYVTYTPPASTAWYLSGGTKDAGSNKSSAIYRSGKVGIGTGTTAPTAGLEILTDGSLLNALRVSSNQAYNSSPDVGIGFRFKYNTAGDYTSGAVISGIKENATDGDQSGSLRFMTNSAGTIAERMRISSSGNMGVGTTSPGSRFHVKSNGSIMRIEGTDHAYFEIFPQGGSTRYGYIGYPVDGSNDLFISNENSSGNLVLSTRNTERLRILSTGQVGIGRSPSTSYILDLNGDMRANSTVYTSDARLKTVMNTWSNDDQIDFVQYRWNTAKDNREHYGYLAQDVQKVLPDAVYADGEGMMAVNYDEVHSYKLALQEKRIKELEQTVDELKKIIKRKRSRRKA